MPDQDLWPLPEVGQIFPSLGRVRCCEEDYGGSHYHCASCGAVTGQYGHYIPSRRTFSCKEEDG